MNLRGVRLKLTSSEICLHDIRVGKMPDLRTEVIHSCWLAGKYLLNGIFKFVNLFLFFHELFLKLVISMFQLEDVLFSVALSHQHFTQLGLPLFADFFVFPVQSLNFLAFALEEHHSFFLLFPRLCSLLVQILNNFDLASYSLPPELFSLIELDLPLAQLLLEFLYGISISVIHPHVILFFLI